MQDLWNALQVNNQYSLLIIASPGKVEFVGDLKHIEALVIQRKYLANERKLMELYSKDSWFEQTLMQLGRD